MNKRKMNGAFNSFIALKKRKMDSTFKRFSNPPAQNIGGASTRPDDLRENTRPTSRLNRDNSSSTAITGK